MYMSCMVNFFHNKRLLLLLWKVGLAQIQLTSDSITSGNYTLFSTACPSIDGNGRQHSYATPLKVAYSPQSRPNERLYVYESCSEMGQ